MSPPDLAGRVVVVTGAARGIGAAVGVEAARLGGKVVLVGRTRAALEEVDDLIRAKTNEPAVLAPVDLTRRDHVDALGGMLFERFGRVDILIHAAGEPGTLTPVAHMDAVELHKVLTLEIVGAQHLIRSFETLLRVATSGRAIFLTCGPAATSPAFFGMAAAAKAGLEALVRSWANELHQTRIRVGLIDPGRVAGTRTELRRYPGGSKDELPDATDTAARILAALQDFPDAAREVVRFQSRSRRS